MTHEDLIRSAANRLIGAGDLEVIAEVFSPDYVAHGGSHDYRGHAFLIRWARQLRRALPDIAVVRITILSQEPDRITWQRTLRGTHQKSLKGIPPSDKRIQWAELVVSRFAGAQIVEEWVVSEMAGVMMGALGRE